MSTLPNSSRVVHSAASMYSGEAQCVRYQNMIRSRLAARQFNVEMWWSIDRNRHECTAYTENLLNQIHSSECMRISIKDQPPPVKK